MNELERFNKINALNLQTKVKNACHRGDIETLKELLKLSPQQDVVDNALCVASLRGNFDLVKFLLFSSDIPLNANVNANKGDAFRDAARSGNLDLVKFMLPLIELKENVFPNMVSAAISAACFNGHLDVIKHVFSNKKLFEYADIEINGRDWLYGASGYGHLNVVKYLLTSDEVVPNVSLPTKEEYNAPLFACFTENQLHVAEYFLKSKELKHNANIHMNNDAIFKSLYDSETYETLKWLIFDLNIEKTTDIEYIIAANPNETVEGWFAIRDLNDSLQQDLPNQNSLTTKRNKI